MASDDPPDHESLRDELRESFSRSDRFLNRELSWLDFNGRVLEEAQDPDVPILERLKFLSIFASNLDEFFMVRVAFVRREIEAGITARGVDGLRPADVMEQIVDRVRQAHEQIGSCFRGQIIPGLAAAGIHFVNDLTAGSVERAFAEAYFRDILLPLLTPLALDAGHPFPELEAGALYFCIQMAGREPAGAPVVLLRLPTNAVSRFVIVPGQEGETNIMWVDDVIRMHLQGMFPVDTVAGCYEIRIARDSELELDEVGSVDLLRAIQDGLQKRRKGAATRLLHDPAMPAELVSLFKQHLKLSSRHIFPGARYHSFSDMMQIPGLLNRDDLVYEQRPPLPVRVLDEAPSIFGILQERDILLHHPYQSFSYVARFLEEAATDAATVSLKATLYRVGTDSAIASALAEAARNGKQVTVLVELKARFDEERNIGWARTLEQAGAHVMYGVPGLKTHCKMLLVVRKEPDGTRRYCHLSTGNYNARTARLYGDIGMLTAHPGITRDVGGVFNMITGGVQGEKFGHLLVAPDHLRKHFVRLVRREADHARAGRPSGIIAKMNSLVDAKMIDELYLAARAGVPIRLIVRGICCLRPGVEGLSDTIEVSSIIDRYLEHARVYRFANGGSPEYFLGSADWMPRNLNGRIEVVFPVSEPLLRNELDSILAAQLGDTVKARLLHADGTHHRRLGSPVVRSQWRCHDLALVHAR